MHDKKAGKLDRHITILCNSTNVRILNYKLTQEEEGRAVLEIVTKIPNKALSADTIYFAIDDKARRIHCLCKWFCTFRQPNIRKYYYHVERIDS